MRMRWPPQSRHREQGSAARVELASEIRSPMSRCRRCRRCSAPQRCVTRRWPGRCLSACSRCRIVRSGNHWFKWPWGLGPRATGRSHRVAARERRAHDARRRHSSGLALRTTRPRARRFLRRSDAGRRAQRMVARRGRRLCSGRSPRRTRLGGAVPRQARIRRHRIRRSPAGGAVRSSVRCRMLESIGREDYRRSATGMIAMRWANQDPAAAASWAASQTEPVARQMAVSAVTQPGRTKTQPPREPGR